MPIDNLIQYIQDLTDQIKGVHVQASICERTCREVMVEMSLSRPSSSFRLYPSGLLSLSLTFHSLMVLSLAGKKNLNITGS